MNYTRRQVDRGKGCLGARGAAAVEFAIVLPLLLLILFGIIEFSLLMYDRIQIATATRELARYASVFTLCDPDNALSPCDPDNAGDIRRSAAEIIDHAINIYDCPPPNCNGNNNGVLDLGDLGLTSLGNRDLQLSVPASFECPNACDTDCFAEVRMSFIHDYLLILPGAKALFPNANWGAIQIRSRTKMRCE